MWGTQALQSLNNLKGYKKNEENADPSDASEVIHAQSLLRLLFSLCRYSLVLTTSCLLDSFCLFVLFGGPILQSPTGLGTKQALNNLDVNKKIEEDVAVSNPTQV